MNKKFNKKDDNNLPKLENVSEAELQELLDSTAIYKDSFSAIGKTEEPRGKFDLLSQLSSGTNPRQATTFWSRNRWIFGSVMATLTIAWIVMPTTMTSQESGAKNADTATSAVSNAGSTEGLNINSNGAVESADRSKMSSAQSSEIGSSANQDTVAPNQGSTSKLMASPPNAGAAMSRDIIFNGSTSVEVTTISEAISQIKALVKRVGGYVENSQLQTVATGSTASMSIRVPSNQFETSLNSVGKLGRILDQSSAGEDVTGAVVDIKSRLKVLRANEESLLQILRTTRRTGEILEVRDRLTQVRFEIESMEGQLANYKNLSKMSTISIQLSEKPRLTQETKGDWAGESYANAQNALVGLTQAIGRFFIWLWVMAPLWVPVGLIAWFISRRANAK